MSLLPWLALALAAPPNKTARVYSIAGQDGGTDRLGNMQVTTDGRLVTGRTAATGIGFVMDVESWRLTTYEGCDVAGVGVDSYDTVWFGCSDGRIIPKLYYRGALYDLYADDGSTFEIEATLGTGHTARALWMDPVNEYLFLFSYGDDQLVNVFAYDPIAFADTDLTTPIATSAQVPGFEESEFVYLNTVTGPSVMLTFDTNQHGQFTYLANDSAGVTGGSVSLLAAAGTENCTDWNDAYYGVYCLDGQVNQLLKYVGGTINPFITISASLGVLDDPKAVIVSDVEGDSWLAVTGGQVKVWELDDNGNFVDPSTPVFTGDAANDNEIQDGVASESVLFGGGINGNLHVSLAAPWMMQGASSVRQDPDPSASGDTVTLTFQWDEDVVWSMYRGGTHKEPGDLLTTGEALKESAVDVDLVIDDDWEEGENDIFILGEAKTDSSRIGHGWLGVNVDNPPGAPVLKASNVAKGESRLVLTFDGIDDADLAYYELYISTESFSANDWETSGPDLDQPPARDPIQITAYPGDRVSYEIGPLDNGTTYYMAVRAFDTGGKESPMSNVVSGTPEQTYGAAELAGETGGSSCSTGSTAASGSLALLLLAGLRRRRKAVATAVAGAALGVSLVPGSARAADEEDHWWKADLTPTRGNFEIRYGGISLEDPYINQVYDTKPKNLLQAEFGPQLFRVFELDGSFGFFQELDKTVFGGGKKSGDRTMLTWYQLSIDATARLHLIDEQPVVPFVRYGWDYVMWNENKVIYGGEKVLRGSNPGSHYGFGVNLLLDLIQPGRASLLEARTGINDTWLTVEWRRQSIDERSRPWQPANVTGSDLYFSGDIFQVGLKLDY